MYDNTSSCFRLQVRNLLSKPTATTYNTPSGINSSHLSVVRRSTQSYRNSCTAVYRNCRGSGRAPTRSSVAKITYYVAVRGFCLRGNIVWWKLWNVFFSNIVSCKKIPYSSIAFYPLHIHIYRLSIAFRLLLLPYAWTYYLFLQPKHSTHQS